MEFNTWLVGQMEKAHVNQSGLAKLAHLNQAAISRILSGQAKPSVDTCKAFSRVFNIPVNEVYLAVGILPPTKEDRLVNIITHLAEQLPTDEDKQDAAEYIRLRLRIAEERGKYETNKKRASRPKPD
jgi:DNA-binding XRE family transcriptional regulator